MLRIGLTGGIGSGKSTAARVFGTLGVHVYDSDTKAKELMVADPKLKADIEKLLGSGAYVDGHLDRAYIAERIFRDKGLLAQMNALVHPAVMNDFASWAEALESSGTPYVIQENAILFEGGFDRLMNYSVTVSAPAPERAARAASRIGISVADVLSRMACQMSDDEREKRADFILDNSEEALMVPQIIKLHHTLAVL